MATTNHTAKSATTNTATTAAHLKFIEVSRERGEPTRAKSHLTLTLMHCGTALRCNFSLPFVLQMFPLETVELPDQWEQLVQWAADSLNRAEQRHAWTWEPEPVAVQAAS